jgi:hypothetical protein
MNPSDWFFFFNIPSAGKFIEGMKNCNGSNVEPLECSIILYN